ncbi:MAG: Cof-type HAD-IIB family hydrolase [Anaeroplasmataceae bacterium]|nr:Cof-type HAD-IIB family hydrolase [Anaeroplasmataceae bacterium]
MVRLCTIDLDGTLFDKDKNISDENKKAIQMAKENGCKIVLASGRPFQGILPTLKQLNLCSKEDYVICYNGAKILNVGTLNEIYSTTISGKTIKEIYTKSKGLGTNFHAFRQNEELITDVDNPYTDVEIRINKIPRTIVDFKEICDEDKFLKCMMVSCDQKITAAMERLEPQYYEQYSVVRSSKIFLEFLNKETNKGNALKVLAEFLDIPLSDTMAIGDAGNDLAMIETARIGVAMENAFAEIKKAANYITASNEASGVAEALNHFINQRKF